MKTAWRFNLWAGKDKNDVHRRVAGHRFINHDGCTSGKILEDLQTFLHVTRA